MHSVYYYHYAVQYNIKICNEHNVCQLAESEVRAVTGGIWYGRVKKP